MAKQTVHYCSDNLEADGFHFTDSFIARCTTLTTRTTTNWDLVTCTLCLQASREEAAQPPLF